ncbi:MAG TPA: hypothetical protein VFW65_02100 [Pseudonocardiaceae bacterium]|nr:hypothetical protein [Pseudonocardiaceae bacterium]
MVGTNGFGAIPAVVPADAAAWLCTGALRRKSTEDSLAADREAASD